MKWFNATTFLIVLFLIAVFITSIIMQDDPGFIRVPLLLLFFDLYSKFLAFLIAKFYISRRLKRKGSLENIQTAKAKGVLLLLLLFILVGCAVSYYNRAFEDNASYGFIEGAIAISPFLAMFRVSKIDLNVKGSKAVISIEDDELASLQ